jgi:AcrR family transcriptional regulator
MFPETDPWFLRPWSCDQPDVLTDAAFELIAEGGTSALTMRALAAQTRMSPSWITDRFTNRARMLAIIADIFGDRWVTWIRARVTTSGIAALLPATDEEIVANRVWLALVELGRVAREVGWRTSAVRRDERAVVARLLACRSGDLRVDDVLAMVDGLRAGMADPERSLHPDRARTILSTHFSRFSVMPSPLTGRTFVQAVESGGVSAKGSEL